jgi:uncharacterized protein YukE
MASSIFKLARSVVRGAINTVKSQANSVSEQITSPLENWVKLVAGGVWKGNGANRFVEEMTREVVPQLVNMFNAFDVFGGTVNKAIDIMDRADREATNKANMLNDVFSKIF